MPLHKSHVSETKRIFAGENRARWLIDWLNNTKDAAARARVLELHRLLFDLVKTATPDKNLPEFDPKSPWEKLRKRVNRILLRYPVFAHVIWFRIGYFTTVYVPLTERRYRKHNLLTESGAVLDLLSVFREPGSWWRVSQCHCGRYYFRRFRHQRFCSEACRVKEFRSSEEWKAHRRNKAREYYWLHKTKHTR
jgi:hypothetical protein